MSDLKKDIIVSGLFVTGAFSFVSGAYIISSAVLASIAVVNSLRLSVD